MTKTELTNAIRNEDINAAECFDGVRIEGLTIDEVYETLRGIGGRALADSKVRTINEAKHVVYVW